MTFPPSNEDCRLQQDVIIHDHTQIDCRGVCGRSMRHMYYSTIKYTFKQISSNILKFYSINAIIFEKEASLDGGVLT